MKVFLNVKNTGKKYNDIHNPQVVKDITCPVMLKTVLGNSHGKSVSS